MKLRLFNSLKGKITELDLQPSQNINIYLCGPTVYDHIHLGNLRPVILFDLLHRLLLSLKIKVNYVQNITDIDDKIVVKAQQTKETETKISQHYTKAYLNNLIRYNILFPTNLPKVTNYIAPLQKFITTLLNQNFAYQQNGEVFFNLAGNQEYGKLSKQNLEKLKSVRKLVSIPKKNKTDFVLWKSTPQGIKWGSPWGAGRPGWHTECAVFIHELFAGQTIDLHGGGNDLLFPHHENERIQYLAHNNRELSKIWFHVAHLHWKGEKMSKSLGNVILAKSFVKKYSPNLFRYLILSSSYKQVINLSPELIKQNDNYLQKIENLLKRLNFYLYTIKMKIETKTVSQNQAIIDCLLDNLNTSRALFILDKAIVALNKGIAEKKEDQIFQETVVNFYFILNLLGFKFELPTYNLKTKLLIDQWQKLVGTGKYEQADQIRNQLIKMNII